LVSLIGKFGLKFWFDCQEANFLQHRFFALDGLGRAAAISVAVYHFYYFLPGYLAMDFFLVLSGFVLTHKTPVHDRRYQFSRIYLASLNGWATFHIRFI
jgi:peptidoglycan/LPS O-acetylase OafA/YrhL